VFFEPKYEVAKLQLGSTPPQVYEERHRSNFMEDEEEK
jgi:hypothetical protein